jgi:hypothetical protein
VVPPPGSRVRAALPAAGRPCVHPARRGDTPSAQPRGRAPNAVNGTDRASWPGTGFRLRSRSGVAQVRLLGRPCAPSPASIIGDRDWIRAGVEISGFSLSERGYAAPCSPFPRRPRCSPGSKQRRGRHQPSRSAAEPGLRRQNRLQLCISGLFFF